MNTITGIGKKDFRMLKNYLYVLYAVVFLFAFSNGCGKKNDTEIKPPAPKANVSVTTIDRANLTDTILMTASSFYNSKSTVLAPISGYLSIVNITNGINISRGEFIFEIVTKEYNALKSSKDLLDSLYIGRRAGRIIINAPSYGQVADLNTLPGQYVQEGTPLCSIIDMSSLLFKLYVPLQYNSEIKPGVKCTLLFPDGKIIPGTVRNLLAKTELNSQTIVYFLKPSAGVKIPEGINIKAYIVKNTGKDSQILPKSAVLATETLNEYWVMKLINDSTAIKTPVTIGNSNNGTIEIKEPPFTSEDRIITEGNYGLPDTALIKISEEPNDK